MDLRNGGHYSGVTTATLTVSSADSGDTADYRCVATAGCGSVTSSQAALTVGFPAVPGDFDGDGDVDQEDFGHFQACLTGPVAPIAGPDRQDADLDGDNRVDQNDLAAVLGCMSGPNIPPGPDCAS